MRAGILYVVIEPILTTKDLVKFYLRFQQANSISRAVYSEMSSYLKPALISGWNLTHVQAFRTLCLLVYVRSGTRLDQNLCRLVENNHLRGSVAII